MDQTNTKHEDKPTFFSNLNPKLFRGKRGEITFKYITQKYLSKVQMCLFFMYFLFLGETYPAKRKRVCSYKNPCPFDNA